MKNYGIQKFKDADLENFTSNTGIKIRRKINPALRKVFKLATKGEIIVDNYPNLNKDESYIFVSLHNFVEDTIANLATIDRNAYLLFGTTDQLAVNKEMYAAWLNGFIYVDRCDPDNRKSSLLKMKRILKSGSSILVFPEGGFNNTENLLCLKLFASPYILAQRTNCKVVPIAPFYEFGSDKIYMRAGDPIDLASYSSKDEALRVLRDNLATLLYYNLENHSTPLKRGELGKDPRMDYMRKRKNEYLKTKWTKDVWDEELTRYLDKSDREYLKMLESLEEINITPNNAPIVGPMLVKKRKILNKKYDFKDYMKKNWNKEDN